MLASFSAGVALVQPKLKWELTDYATLANGILTVDVPPGAKPGLYGATAYVGFEPFEGRSLGAKVMAGGEVVFNMNTFEITSGESLYPRENGNYRVGQVQGCTQKSAWRDFGD